MNRLHATTILHNALTSYCEDCVGSEEYEEERKLIDEAWEFMQEPELTPEEVNDMRTILNNLDINSTAYDTQMKVMRALGIKI